MRVLYSESKYSLLYLNYWDCFFQALIDATSGSNALDVACEIVLVISNKANVEGLKRAERADIPTKVSHFIHQLFECNNYICGKYRN